MVEEHWVVSRNRQLNMTKVARASKVVLRTCGTTAGNLSNMADLIVIKGRRTFAFFERDRVLGRTSRLWSDVPRNRREQGSPPV